jgi:heme a synthase
MNARLRRFAWGVLAYNVAVILWGAYVRATGSGAGCGSHWPLCGSEVIPREPTTATIIEFSHRLTSGLALLTVIALVIWVWRACPPGHLARRSAAWSLFFILGEAAIGAGLVLFELVADNATMARALFMGAHLVNTFVLLAFLTLTAEWLSNGGASLPVWGRALALHRSAALSLSAGAALLLATGTSGAVAALGDTLYPAASLGDAMRADLSITSHVLIRLRVLHPAIAVATALLVMFGAPRLAAGASDRARRRAWSLAVALAIQLAAGFLNVVLLAPVWMQLVHLLLADVVWILFVLLGAEILGAEAVFVRVPKTMPGPRRVDRAAAEPGLRP